MAVPSKPALRSSRRQSTFLPDDPPTVAQPKSHLPPRHLGKRAHDIFLPNGDHRPTKRLKPNSDSILQPVLASKNPNYNSFTLSRSIVDVSHTAASSPPSPRITTAVQPLADGTLITNGNSNVEVKEPEITRRIVNNGKGVQKALKVVDKRTLRSQDGGSRSKSELSLYFPNYEELISNEPKESEFLSPDTKILIVDEAPKAPISQVPKPPPFTSAPLDDHATNTSPQIPDDLDSRPKTLTDVRKLDLSAVAPLPQHPTTDPLNDSFYFKAHRRAERQEKQLRNIEKERAQHEKVQLERLLEGLKGHDWLRVMGISGITDSEKKSYEPKRDYFVHEVRCLIEKFKRWKEEEKRRKVEKEQSIKADDDDDDDENESVVADSLNDASTPDVDALAAMQLHNESLSASKTRRKVGRPTVGPLQPPPIEKPFTSFYTKPYIRQAALSKHRRGRTRFAFGHPVPETAERSFRLPAEMLTDDAIRASARSRRRARRESKDV